MSLSIKDVLCIAHEAAEEIVRDTFGLTMDDDNYPLLLAQVKGVILATLMTFTQENAR